MRIGCLVVENFDGSFKLVEAGPDLRVMESVSKQMQIEGSDGVVKAVHLFVTPAQSRKLKVVEKKAKGKK